MRILVVDDEPELVKQIQEALIRQQYTVDIAYDGEAALSRIFADPYDLILLDIMLPGKDGYSVLSELRQEKIATPVLMLTARGEIEDKILGLDKGADDYLGKPFAMEELFARIRALLRRSNDCVSSQLTCGAIRLDTASREVRQNDQTLELTPKEFSILEFLLYNKGRVISRFTIAEHVWGDAFDPYTMSNSIDVHIKNLRHKMGEEGALIHSIRGVGYSIKENTR